MLETKPITKLIIGGLLILGAGSTGILVLVKASMIPAQGARASTRLQWEVREAEIEKAARDHGE